MLVRAQGFRVYPDRFDNYADGIERFLAVFFHSCALQFVLSDIKALASAGIIQIGKSFVNFAAWAFLLPK
jgi:hypothetical protein